MSIKDKIKGLFTSDYVGKDGVERDLGKLGAEYRILKADMNVIWAEFKAHPNGHNWTDLFVESSRSSPYFMGHVYATIFPLIVIGIVAAVVAVVAGS